MTCSINRTGGLQLFTALTLIFLSVPVNGQGRNLTGWVYDLATKQPLEGVRLELQQNALVSDTDELGYFAFPFLSQGRDTISLYRDSYMPLVLPFEMNEASLDLGIIYMDRESEKLQDQQRTILSEADLEVASEDIANTSLLSASGDLLAKRAAFDLSPVFFKMRGYDSRDGEVLINGISMNRVFRGRPQWNNWGGLNDVFRNKEVSLGLAPSPKRFGGLLGTTSLITRPGSLRPGFRITTSASNRIYTARVMATYNKIPENNGWGYTLSMSRRWSEEGYKDGTAYDAYSGYGALEYQFNTYSSVFITAFLAANVRGSSAAITQEVLELVGRRYNPYWGYQGDEKRNSRLRYIKEPVIMANYEYRDPDLIIEAGLAYQWGNQSRTRLGYYNAPNPGPDYYRNLPSYYINSPVGPNLISAESSGIAFKKNAQIDWAKLIRANNNPVSAGRASYILYGDEVKEHCIRANLNTSISLGRFLHLDGGIHGFYSNAHYYARIHDLLGAGYHSDIDPFSGTRNDLNGPESKMDNELFGYSYRILAQQMELFAQLRLAKAPWSGHLSGSYYKTTFQRDGNFQNERFPDNSMGPGDKLQFAGYAFKGGISYELTKRHWFVSNAFYRLRSPVLAGIYVNPRENNLMVPDIQNEKIGSIDVSYFFLLPELRGRITAYYTRFRDLTEINFFYVESGVGADFVQQLSTGLDHLHKGLETGFLYSPSSTITLSLAASFSRFLYASDPNISLYFDTAGSQEELINPNGHAKLGKAALKGLHLAKGPSQAVSFGFEFRHPRYWWLSTTLNWLAENYTSLARVIRTNSFLIDPDTGNEYHNLNQNILNRLLKQSALEEVYLINISMGKSWILEGKYFSVFLNITNLFDTTYRSGGFDQSRKGTYSTLYLDRLGGRPSFGSKYWYGFGRTFFLNLSISF